MKRAVKTLAILAVVVVALVLLLVPIATIWVATPYYGSPGAFAYQTGSASVMYAYLGVGAVYVPNPPNPGGVVDHTYCLVFGNPGVMCGYDMHRTPPLLPP